MRTKVFVSCVFFFSLIQFSQQLDFYYQKIATSKAFASKVEEYLGQNRTRTSSKCHSHMRYYLQNLLSSDVNNTLWAKKMFDSGTKMPSGILNGNVADYGAYDQCMNILTIIDYKDMHGKYCLGSVPLSLDAKNSKEKLQSDITSMEPQTRTAKNPDGQTGLIFATCLPNSCSTEEIQDMYNSFELGSVKVKFFDVLCQSKPTQPKFSAGDITVITFLSIVFAIMIFSTIYHVILYYTEKESAHTLLTAFSILENGKKLIKVTNSSKHISCLHGIRVLSMVWIIFSHRYYQALAIPLQNTMEMKPWIAAQHNMYIMGATVSVDSFLLLSGLVVAYGFMSLLEERSFNVFVFYLHRYLRLTPIFVVVMLFYLTIFKYLGDGPMWLYQAERYQNECKDTWWSALLYIQNFNWPICIAQSWYLSVDTQLYVLSPLILLPLKQWPRVGHVIIVALTFSSILSSFLAAWFYKLSGMIMGNDLNSTNFTSKYYTATHTRASPWLMGIALGYLIYQIKANKRKIVIKKIIVLFLWAFSIAVLLACVFTGHNLLLEEYDRLDNSLEIAFVRPGWAIALAILILLCVLDYGGPINWFLSMPLFQILSKLTYSMYLIHLAMQMIIYAQSRTVLYLTDLYMWYAFWGDYIFTLGASILFSLAFESPIITIEKFLFARSEGKVTPTLESGENN